MKLLFRNTDRGCSCSHNESYYLCETQEEYDTLVKKYENHKNYIREYDDFLERWVERPNDLQVFIGVHISSRPAVSVSDGVAIYGGHTLDAERIKVQHNSGTAYTDYTSYEYYIKPGSVKKFEKAKTESWWT